MYNEALGTPFKLRILISFIMYHIVKIKHIKESEKYKYTPHYKLYSFVKLKLKSWLKNLIVMTGAKKDARLVEKD